MNRSTCRSYEGGEKREGSWLSIMIWVWLFMEYVCAGWRGEGERKAAGPSHTPAHLPLTLPASSHRIVHPAFLFLFMPYLDDKYRSHVSPAAVFLSHNNNTSALYFALLVFYGFNLSPAVTLARCTVSALLSGVTQYRFLESRAAITLTYCWLVCLTSSSGMLSVIVATYYVGDITVSRRHTLSSRWEVGCYLWLRSLSLRNA